LFDRAVVGEMIAEHRSGSRDRTRELRALIAVELWARIFLDADPADLFSMGSVSFGTLGIDFDFAAGCA